MEIDDWSAGLAYGTVGRGKDFVEESTARAEKELMTFNHGVLSHDYNITKLVVSTKVTQGRHHVVRTEAPLKI